MPWTCRESNAPMTAAPFRTPEGGVLLWSLIGEYLRAFAGVKVSPGRRLCKLSYGKHPLSIKIFPQIILLNERSQANISSSHIYLLEIFHFFDMILLFCSLYDRMFLPKRAS